MENETNDSDDEPETISESMGRLSIEIKKNQEIISKKAEKSNLRRKRDVFEKEKKKQKPLCV